MLVSRAPAWREFLNASSAPTTSKHTNPTLAHTRWIDAFGLKRDEIAFVAFAGWDAAGAKSFGYPTFWVNRLNLPVEELGVAPDAIGGNLSDLVTFIKP